MNVGIAQRDSLFIGGGWRAPSGPGRTTLFSASTNIAAGSVPTAVPGDVDVAVTAARRAFDDPLGWSSWEPAQRAEVMERFAGELRARGEHIAQAVSIQNGMPISTAMAMEAVMPHLLTDYYAGLIRQAGSIEESRDSFLGGTTLVRKKPLGVIGLVVPWNFPQSLTFFKLAPALAAGNTVVIKPSSETVLDAFIVGEAAHAAGFPDGVINILSAGSGIGEYLVSHPGVDKISFTGSTAVGRSIAAKAGQLLRPVTLELGGKSAAIVLDDVDLASIGEQAFAASLLNNGQTCFASTRILAPRSRYDEVVGFYEALAQSATVGNSLDSSTTIGPVVSKSQRDSIEEYIQVGRGEGRLVAGGDRAGFEEGWFVSPTVFADVDNGARIAQEEIFGPVLVITPYGDDDEAVRIANDSVYGLAGSVWSSSPERALGVARRVETGTIGVNHYLPDPAAPYGGVKQSGLGRELGPESLSYYQQLQSVYLR